jgi:hypothetical protein
LILQAIEKAYEGELDGGRRNAGDREGQPREVDRGDGKSHGKRDVTVHRIHFYPFDLSRPIAYRCQLRI